MALATTYGFRDLSAGSIWEHYASTCIGDGELNGRYELTKDVVPPTGPHDPLVSLTNLETGGVATVTSKSLRVGPLAQPHPHWELVS